MLTPAPPRRSNKILIFGGAFDPVHRGHLGLLKAAQRQIRPTKTLVIPSSDLTAHKGMTLLPAATRLELATAAFKRLPATYISTLEIEKSSPPYTWQTLSILKRRYPGHDFYLLLGSDSLANIKKWRRAATILGDPDVYFVTARRPRHGLGHVPPRTIVLDARLPDLSSSRLKDLLLGSRPNALGYWSKALPTSAARRLREPAILTCIIKAYLARKLPAQRYRHTLCVARLAAELAPRPLKTAATIAALLHDASRTNPAFTDIREALGHARISVGIASNVFGIRDVSILRAIAAHTTGTARMDLLARILYVADFASYDRTFSAAAKIRALARKNLALALRRSAYEKLGYLIDNGQPIDTATIAFWNTLWR
ncbi:MAG: HD domain-containing protein [Elusimicrobiota bacterium]